MMWDTVIGLEVHAQLKTHSKLFSGSSTIFGAPPNSQTSFIDAGLPGVLPVLNHQAVQMAIKFGLAIDAQINNLSYFERKNYFYPDLPKGYQISQFQCPIVSDGFLSIETSPNEFKKITILRAHLEEDAGKSIHDTHDQYTGIDLNRAGTPLLEIVTTPCLSSAAEAILYLKSLHQLLVFLDLCDGNMQEGSFRCDVNLSLKPNGSSRLGTRTELKNLNSFRFIEKAILYEQIRHQEALESGQALVQETRYFCPVTQRTQRLRSKENEFDYRYFPDPDLLPIRIDAAEIERIKHHLPKLPQSIQEELKPLLPLDDIHFLLSCPETYNFFDEVRKQTQAPEKLILNWMKGFKQPSIPPYLFALFLDKIHSGVLSNANAKQVFKQSWRNEDELEALIKKQESKTLTDDSELASLITQVIQQYPEQAEQYRQGKIKLLAFFVGQVMKQTKGQADPERVSQIITKQISNS